MSYAVLYRPSGALRAIGHHRYRRAFSGSTTSPAVVAPASVGDVLLIGGVVALGLVAFVVWGD